VIPASKYRQEGARAVWRVAAAGLAAAAAAVMDVEGVAAAEEAFGHRAPLVSPDCAQASASREKAGEASCSMRSFIEPAVLQHFALICSRKALRRSLLTVTRGSFGIFR
jgi:hypothetical protein